MIQNWRLLNTIYTLVKLHISDDLINFDDLVARLLQMVYDFVNNKSDYLAVGHTSIALQLEKYKSYERKI